MCINFVRHTIYSMIGLGYRFVGNLANGKTVLEKNRLIKWTDSGIPGNGGRATPHSESGSKGVRAASGFESAHFTEKTTAESHRGAYNTPSLFFIQKCEPPTIIHRVGCCSYSTIVSPRIL